MKAQRTKIFLNGRFLTRPITGVERTAYELVLALDHLIGSNPEEAGRYQFILIYSGAICNPIQLDHIRLLNKGRFTGNLWEQLELPVFTYGHLLISMCTVSTLFKRKQLVIIHDASFAANPGFFPEKVRRWYLFAVPALGKMIRQVITVSEFSKTELIKFFGFKADKITVIPNAANHILRFTAPGEAFKAKINAAKPYILAVSSQSANKNFKVVSEAIRQMDFSGYQVLIAGGVISTLKQTAMDPAVQALGYVSNEELNYLYSQASIFVFPSFYEGFGIPPLEAMISGCPVISSNTSSLPEVLGNACLYFNPNSSDELATQLQGLMRSPEKQLELKARGLHRASLYNWQTSANQIFKLIKEYGN